MVRLVGEQVTVTSRADGLQATATLLRCPLCNGGYFVCLLIPDGKDLHLQCVNCEECYCAHDSECNRLPK